MRAVQGLVDNTVYYVRVVDDNTIKLFDTAANALNIQVETGIRDLGDAGTGDEHTLFTSRVFIDDNQIYFPKHGLFTGNGVYYRGSKSGSIGGLNSNGLYFIYKIDDNFFKLAVTQADATNKNIAGEDEPVTIDLTSHGKGYQRFEKSS